MLPLSSLPSVPVLILGHAVHTNQVFGLFVHFPFSLELTFECAYF